MLSNANRRTPASKAPRMCAATLTGLLKMTSPARTPIAASVWSSPRLAISNDAPAAATVLSNSGSGLHFIA